MSEQSSNEQHVDEASTVDQTALEVVDAVVRAVKETTDGLTFPAPPRPENAPHGPVEALDAIENGRKQGLTE